MIPIISIIFSIGLPVFAIWRTEKHGELRYPYLFSIGSFIFCGSAMIMELVTVKRRLFAGDIGGIEDTIDAVLMICVILLIVVVILNLLLLGLTFGKAKDEKDR